MSLICNIASISKSYGGIFHVLEGCSLEIPRGARIGVIGPNGAGKSTLFRLIAGVEEPDSGAIWHHPGLTVGYLAQEPRFPPDATLLACALAADSALQRLHDEMAALEAQMADPATYSDAAALARVMERYDRCLHEYEHADGTTYRSRVEGTLGDLGFAPDQFDHPVQTLSGGQRKRLGLACLLIAQPDLLLLDEPDNHLDMPGKRRLEQMIARYPGTVLIISHDRYLLDVVADSIAEVNGGQVIVWPGNYSSYAFEKNVATQSQLRAYEVQQREIRRMESSIRRLISWSRGGDLEATYKRAMAMQKRLDRIERIERPQMQTRTMALRLRGSRGSDKALEIRGLWKQFDTPDGPREVLTEADLLLWSGEIVGLIGANGAGKSVLFRLIRGELEPTAGDIRIGPSTEMAYYAQEHQTLDRTRTVVEEIRRTRPMYEAQAYDYLGRFLFGKQAAQKPISALSGGEKSRLQFAKLLLFRSNFLLLDEPTNNLDIPSAEALERELEQYEGTALIITHDRYLLDSVATRIVELRDGQLYSYDGGWQDYLEAQER